MALASRSCCIKIPKCATRLPAGSFSGDKLRMSWQQGNCAFSANYSTRSYNVGQLWIWLNMAMVGTNNTIQHDKRYHNVWHTVLSRLWPPRRPHVLWRKGCGNATDNECLRGSTMAVCFPDTTAIFPGLPVDWLGPGWCRSILCQVQHFRNHIDLPGEDCPPTKCLNWRFMWAQKMLVTKTIQNQSKTCIWTKPLRVESY